MYASNSRIQNMSNDLPPFVSNSPPPLCHSDSIESDDDFGDFSTAYEAYDSPKKKAPDLCNGIPDHTSNDIIPPTKYLSQAVLCDYVTKMKSNNHLNSVEITNDSVHTIVEQIPNCADTTNNSLLGESNTPKVLPYRTSNESLNCIDNCTEFDSKGEAVSRLKNGESSNVIENSALSSIENVIAPKNDLNVDESIQCKYVDTIDSYTVLQNVNEPVPCRYIATIDINTVLQATNNSVLNTEIVSPCDIPNLNLNTIEPTDSSSFAKVNVFNLTEDKLPDHLVNEIPSSENSLSSCETQEKPKRGISSEIKKFLEHEKDIENEFTHFESKFRSLEITPSAGLEAGLSPNTPSTSPEFGPKMSKSFDDDLDDEYGSFENFTLKSNENSADFGDFKSSQDPTQDNQSKLTVETVYLSKHAAPPSSEANLKALKEDVISTEDIKLEFSEQNICDSSETTTAQTPACHSTLQETLQPPLDVEEIFFEDKDDSFEPDFSQFESAAILESETCCKHIENSPITEGPVTSVSNTVENENSCELNDDDFGDFNSAVNDLPVSKQELSLVSQAVPETSSVQDDDFGDFTNESYPLEDDEEFGNFDTDCSSTSAPVRPISSIAPHQKKCDVNISNMTDFFEKPVQELPECPVRTLDLCLSQDQTWHRLHDIENTPALSYQWANSASNKVLLSALHIDTRNIIFGPRWKENVPRFAANLGYSPLEPSKPGDSLCGETSSSLPDHIPDAHFDWNGSGLTNPLDGCLSYLLHHDVVSLFDTLSTSRCRVSSTGTKSSRQALEEELTGPSTLSPNVIPTMPHPQITTPVRTTSSAELIINVEKFIESLPSIGFMLAPHVVYPGK